VSGILKRLKVSIRIITEGVGLKADDFLSCRQLLPATLLFSSTRNLFFPNLMLKRDQVFHSAQNVKLLMVHLRGLPGAQLFKTSTLLDQMLANRLFW
jgi:hypothetical protein